jgi:hypothetical protein
MKHKLKLFTIALLFHATSTTAMPILSPDGASLTGLDVGGSLYDVMFGNGVVDEVYAGVTFDAAREAEANAVSAAIVAALTGLNTSPRAIDGCDDPTLPCLLFNPDSFGPLSPGGVDRYVDNGPAEGVLGRFGQIRWYLDTAPSGLRPTDNTSGREITLVRYERVSVPEPATLGLFGLGLAGIGFHRRIRHTHS